VIDEAAGVFQGDGAEMTGMGQDRLLGLHSLNGKDGRQVINALGEHCGVGFLTSALGETQIAMKEMAYASTITSNWIRFLRCHWLRTSQRCTETIEHFLLVDVD
jgi:hypothetical protein